MRFPDFIEKLAITIYLIGYSSQGESILFYIQTDKRIFFSGVIDCYAENNSNITINLCKEIGINTLDLLLWSHPDLDHSKGIENLLPLTNESTAILLPYGYSEHFETWEHVNPDMSNFLDAEIKKPCNVKNKACIRPVHRGVEIEHKQIRDLQGLFDSYSFSIKAFSPDTQYIDHGSFSDIDIQHNDLAVGLWLTLGNASIIFASDVPNRHYGYLQNQPRLFVDYLKIPHHGSNSSCGILNYINKKIDTCTTSVFENCHLPDAASMKKYIEKANNVFSTKGQICENGINYGIVTTQIDVVKSINIETQLFGTASVYIDPHAGE